MLFGVRRALLVRVPQRLVLTLCLVTSIGLASGTAEADDVDPAAIGRAIEALVAAGVDAEDEALVTARTALARCRDDLASRRVDDARRRCALAEAALTLARERALYALARGRRTP